MKQIRFLMETYEYSGKPQPWKMPGYVFYHCQNYNDSNSIQDTGFGSRLNFWSDGYLIGKNYPQYKIVYCLDQYPESYFLKFPNTYFITKEKFFTGINHFKHISNRRFSRLRNKEHINLSDLMYVNSTTIGHDESLSLITLHYDSLRVDLERVFKKYVAVHLRRYYGIKWIESDLNHLTPSQREDYIQDSSWKSTSDTWQYIPDDVYLKEMKKYSHDTMFYVSTDLPAKYYLKYWKSILPGQIVTRDDIIDDIKQVFVRYYGEGMKYKMLYQMIDWFVLLYCRELLIFQPSSARGISAFSETALAIGSSEARIIPV